MKILAVETATEACSAALLWDGELRERFVVEPQAHSRLILPMMDELLAEADLRLGQLDALAFGRGPGSFTGLRIAAGVVQGAAFGGDLPVVPVSTLAALAQRVFTVGCAQRVLASLDARISEVYWGAFVLGGDGLADVHGTERVCAPADTPLSRGDGWVGVGSGWSAYAEILKARHGSAVGTVISDALPQAAEVARLAAREVRSGRTFSADQAQPVYLRDNVARKRR